MEQINKLKDVVFGFLSPSKRRHTIQAIQASTPSAIVKHPLHCLSEPKGKERKVISGRVNRKHASPADKERYRRRLVEQFLEELPHADSTDVEMNSGDSASQWDDENDIVDSIEDQREEISEDGDEAEKEAKNDAEDRVEEDLNAEMEPEVDTQARDKYYLDYQTQVEQRQRVIDRVNKTNWDEEEVDLFYKLTMRGYEPMMHSSWQYDFRTCPPILFSNDEDLIHIDSRSNEEGSNFRGIRALRCLGTMGPRVRDLKRLSKPSELFIKREIQAYLKWSEKDGGYHHLRFLPVICIIAASPDQSANEISNNTTAQFEFLAQRHRDALALPAPGRVNKETGKVEMYRRKPPIIYGIIIAQGVIVLTTLDSAKIGELAKVIAHYNFTSPATDLWNAFSIAIAVTSARNYTMQFIDEYEEDDKLDSDPDA